ncbi:hypothetical protein LC653_28570 [Nostoc sp. CHAB 5784]|uniref:hypothetical protein n=1 Tax=Nostoc mirabile TaxID=2907820 RepID=UPI001E5820FC|nr:hypothetical protein [Nostoc mirabile]MCC5667726.1 hypothetical protein [Nostoc mirabile CHAB5784]
MMNVRRIFEALHLHNAQFILPLAALLEVLVGACVNPSSTQQKLVPIPPLKEIVATLEDEVQELSDNRIAWSTYWKLCWQSYPGAKAYELQTLTGEGASPKLHRQSDRCFRIEAAAGENLKSQGLFNRKVLLLLQRSQLAYRVRAILDENRVSEWSAAMAVGDTTTEPRLQTTYDFVKKSESSQ